MWRIQIQRREKEGAMGIGDMDRNGEEKGEGIVSGISEREAERKVNRQKKEQKRDGI